MKRETDGKIVKGSLKAISRVSGTGTIASSALEYIEDLEALINDMYLKTWPYMRDEGTIDIVEMRMQRLGLMDP